ncbi:hypothetical protein EPA93_04450 [Ktedonosporobacter rubrisoli]|uniref:ABC transporter substrate-binding protein n=1 Tax=Ktedonosporobacter rubrisoli TaxID=2509675 RepID=A0A4P6JJI0_KTERU|nr:ABC transporter substrate-binding protein [Ktedonosporobacter rubrisoli]QBD75287.1 hypothetical protein EPA93_04450 [Ktedonosporobacter rubrisoli]
MLKRKYLAALLLTTAMLLTSACGGQNASTASKSASSMSAVPTEVTIAYQPSMGSANLIVLKQQGTLEKQFPHTRIQWKLLNSGSAVREAMIANQAQLGYMGVPPFLVGWDRGVNWKVLAATSKMDAWLVAREPRFKSLRDFKPGDKIAVVAPDSLQAINLRKAALAQLGNAHALDSNLVVMTPPDAEQALLTGQVAANMGAPPFQYREVAAGGHRLLRGYDIFGQVTTDEVVILQNFYAQYPDFARKLSQDLVEATTFLNSHHEEAAQYLARDQLGKATAAQYKTWLDQTGSEFETTPVGLLSFAQFMQSIGLISKVPGSEKELCVPAVAG